jgi:hypothetical protein
MKSLKSIPLLIGFLLLIQIAKGQISYKIIGHSGKQVCIPVTLMDTMIRDLKERKLLLRKDSLNKAYISILSNDNANRQTKIYETEKSFIISESKRKRNGWQRNFFILSTTILIILCTK